MERILALYDSDVYYATHFMEYFKKEHDFGFEVVVFTSKDSLEEYLRRYTIDLLLLGETVTPEDISTDRIKNICQLTNKSGSASAGDYPCIIKYQAAQSLMSDILAAYRKQENDSEQMPGAHPLKLTCIYSPVPNQESLLFVWSAASLLSRDSKVLLVLLEPFPVQVISGAASTEQALTEFIYYLKEAPDVITRMNTLLGYQGNIAYLAGVENGADILAVTKEDIQKWVAELKGRTDYQQVVFFIGTYSDAAVELMKRSDFVLLLEKDGLYDGAVMKEFTRQLERSGADKHADKLHKLILPQEDASRQFPVTPAGLAETASWYLAEQNISLFL